MLKVSSIDVFYGAFQALWDISLHIDKGELVALVGSNGAGKTTVLRAISGIVRPKVGSVEFLNQRLNNLPPHKACELGIGLIPEGRKIFPYMTTLENLEMGAYSKRARSEKGETLKTVYGLFPILKERKSQMASTLSGGEQQMLAIGRGLMSRPSLLMLDEPSLGLAPKLMAMIFDAISDLKRQDVTTLLVEQSVHYALKLADRAYVLETGRIALEGSSEELLDNPHVKKAYLGI